MNDPFVALTYWIFVGSNVRTVLNDPTPHVLTGWLFATEYEEPFDGTAGDHGAVVVMTVPVFDAIDALMVDTSR
jgi:hypothetical protein